MSYNIDTVEMLSNDDLRIRGDMIEKALEELGDNKPEICFLDDFPDPYDRRSKWKPDEWYKIGRVEWSGCASGNYYDELLEIVLSKTMGEASMIYIWEHGDSHSGVYVCDGVVEKREVELKLGKKIK